MAGTKPRKRTTGGANRSGASTGRSKPTGNEIMPTGSALDTVHAPSPAAKRKPAGKATAEADVTTTPAIASARRRQEKRVKVRAWREEDIPAVLACHRAAYPDYDESGQ